MEQCLIKNLYDLSGTIAADLFEGHQYPWEVLPLISDYIRKIGPTLDRALSVYPKNVVFLKGLNDCDAEEPDSFIQRYTDWVAYIRQTLPNANIYICSLLPPSKALGAVRPDLARSPLYDDALKAWCPTAGVTYIDLNWLVYQHLYLSDGIHFTKSFYQLFLRYATVCIKGWEGVPR